MGSGNDRPFAGQPHLPDHPYRLYPAQASCRHQDVRFEGSGRRRRHQPVRRARDGACRDRRHRLDRRRGDGHSGGRTGCGLLDVAHRRVRHRDEVRGGLRGSQIPREGPSRRNARRRHVRVGARVRAQGRAHSRLGEGRRGAVRAVRCYCFHRHGLCRPGKRHDRHYHVQFPHRPAHHWCHYRHSDGGRHLRRRRLYL